MIVRFGTEVLLNARRRRSWRRCASRSWAPRSALLLVALWANRGYPGMSLAFIGILANAVVILVNGGYMPIYLPSLAARRVSTRPTSRPSLHTIMPPALDASFLLHLGPFADVIPIPFPIIQNVASIGDVFLTLGLAFFLFAARRPRPAGARRGGARRDPDASRRPRRVGPPIAGR